MSTVRFLGKYFHTDDEKLYNYLLQLHEHVHEAYKYDDKTFEEKFPGVLETALAAIDDISTKQLRVERLVYINGVMQAWCQPGFGDPVTGLPHPPSKLYPNNKLYPVESR